MRTRPAFWKKTAACVHVDLNNFLSAAWQTKNSITSAQALHAFIRNQVSHQAADDFSASLNRAPMQIKLTPYVLSLIDWKNFYTDPVRKQFIPIASEYVGDHPTANLDSLAESRNSPVQGIVHRYPGKVLFLATRSCPVYCRFCTRSYLVGGSTQTVKKARAIATPHHWGTALDYIAQHPQIQDVLISGGDAYAIPPPNIHNLIGQLLKLPNIRHIRLATKCLAVCPGIFLSRGEWSKAILAAASNARRRRIQFSLQTHFNHATEITWVTQAAADILFDHGVTIRNQTVLLRGVNDNFESLKMLLISLSDINIQPYYVYLHDVVPGAEGFRTSLQTALDLEEKLRGFLSGYNTPSFVVDLPGGGGKRPIWSFRAYDRVSGISEYRSPVVDQSRIYYYYDPVTPLEASQAHWS